MLLNTETAMACGFSRTMLKLVGGLMAPIVLLALGSALVTMGEQIALRVRVALGSRGPGLGAGTGRRTR